LKLRGLHAAKGAMLTLLQIDIGNREVTSPLPTEQQLTALRQGMNQ
jgi:hypothetical protein